MSGHKDSFHGIVSPISFGIWHYGPKPCCCCCFVVVVAVAVAVVVVAVAVGVVIIVIVIIIVIIVIMIIVIVIINCYYHIWEEFISIHQLFCHTSGCQVKVRHKARLEHPALGVSW